ncbi:hypothetical protein NXZ88_24915 [Escherichia coli]|nr:hypothetical protein [Escherichia coli]
MAAKLKGISRLKKSEKQADEYPDELWKFMSPSEKAKFLVADVFSRSSKEPSAVQPGEHKQKDHDWICPYISRHLLSLNPLLACCRRYSRGER